MTPKSTRLLKEIAQYDWAVEGFTAGKTTREIVEALDKRNALVHELGDLWRKEEIK